MDDRILHSDLSYKIVGLAMQVHTELGYGFLEKVYENSLMVLLRHNGISALQQVPITVQFHEMVVGEYFADIVVEDAVILELKAAEHIADAHKAQGHRISFGLFAQLREAQIGI